jgi:hypothetical protein
MASNARPLGALRGNRWTLDRNPVAVPSGKSSNALLPSVIAFLLFQRQFNRGVSIEGLAR